MIDMTETIDESMTEEMAKKRVRYLKAKEEGFETVRNFLPKSTIS